MKTKLFLIILFFTLFFIKSVLVPDPDFGWHLKSGEHILKYGIPKTDPFSYTMPDYPFVDHEYLTNAAIARTYPLLKMQGLALVFSLLAIVPFLYYFRKNSLLPFLPLALVCATLFVGVRPQVITWIFVWIFISLLGKRKVAVRSLILLVLLQTLWANMHGGFFVGLILSGIYTITDAIEKKRLDMVTALYLIVSALATLINPYGYRVWWEVGMQLSDQSLRWTIQEWMPAFVLLDISYWVYLGISGGFFIRHLRKLSIFSRAAYLLFLTAGLMSIRNIPLWVIASLPPLLQSTQTLSGEVPKTNAGRGRIRLFYKIVTAAVALVCLVQLVINGVTFREYSQDVGYPEKAVYFIRQNKLEGNVLASYHWGGYLIWKMPEKKVFIDGRMPSWRRDTSDPRYSSYAYREYREIISEKSGYEKLIRKYRVSYLLLMKEKEDKKGKPRFENMKIRYSDDVAVLYETGIK